MVVVLAFQILIIIRVLLFTESLLAVLNIISLIQVRLIGSVHANSLSETYRIYQLRKQVNHQTFDLF